MSNFLSPTPRQLFLNPSDGTPASGFKLFTYAAATTTKLATYVDEGTTANTNPIIMDSLGECDLWIPADIKYKYVFSPPTDTDPPTNPIWTVDEISVSSGGSGGGGNSNVFENRAAVQVATIPSSVNTIETLGYTSAGIGGGTYARSALEPSITAKIQSADGAWWAWSNPVADIIAFGADATGIVSSSTALNSALANFKEVSAPVGTFLLGEQILWRNDYTTLTGQGVDTIFNVTYSAGNSFVFGTLATRVQTPILQNATFNHVGGVIQTMFDQLNARDLRVINCFGAVSTACYVGRTTATTGSYLTTFSGGEFDCTADGIVIESSAGGLTLTDLFVLGGNAASGKVGVKFLSGTSAFSRFDGFVLNSGSGIGNFDYGVQQNDNHRLTNLIWDGARIDGCVTNNAIFTNTTAGGIEGFICSGMTFGKHVSGVGTVLRLEGTGLGDINITGCRFDYNGSAIFFAPGTGTDSAYGIVISSNQFALAPTNATTDGIIIGGEFHGLVLTNNALISSTGANAVRNFILFSGFSGPIPAVTANRAYNISGVLVNNNPTTPGGSYAGGTINAGLTVAGTFSAPGVDFGDFITPSYNKDLQGIDLFISVSSANNVKWIFQNNTAGNITLIAGSILARVTKIWD